MKTTPKKQKKSKIPKTIWTKSPAALLKKRHVRYTEIISRSPRAWGGRMNSEQAASPTNDFIKMGCLLEIVALLQEIKTELKKPRTIS